MAVYVTLSHTYLGLGGEFIGGDNWDDDLGAHNKVCLEWNQPRTRGAPDLRAPLHPERCERFQNPANCMWRESAK